MRVRALMGAGVLTAVGGVLLTAAPATATHTHVMPVGNGRCVVIAEEAGEEAVELPGAVFENNPNVDIAPAAGRNHPLHVLVHQGVAGEQHPLYVYGTAAADAACTAGYVNR